MVSERVLTRRECLGSTSTVSTLGTAHQQTFSGVTGDHLFRERDVPSSRGSMMGLRSTARLCSWTRLARINVGSPPGRERHCLSSCAVAQYETRVTRNSVGNPALSSSPRWHLLLVRNTNKFDLETTSAEPQGPLGTCQL